MIFNHHIPRIESHLKFLIASINFVPTSKFQIRRRGEILIEIARLNSRNFTPVSLAEHREKFYPIQRLFQVERIGRN